MQDSLLYEILEAAKDLEVSINDLTRAKFLDSPNCKRLTNRQIINLGGWDHAKNLAGSLQQRPKSFTSKDDLLIVTYAQNATPVHRGFLLSIKSYIKKNGGRLVVLPGRYKNPTSMWSQQQEQDEWWDESLEGHLQHDRLLFGDHLVIDGSVSIAPTAQDPISGFEAFVREHSTIFGHPKQSFRPIPTDTRMPKVLATPGAITIPNYTDSKAGAKGARAHKIGAIVIQKHGDRFHMRQLAAEEDGSFYDLEHYYTRKGYKKSPKIPGIVLGDLHVEKSEASVLDATFDILEALNPEQVILHDTLDFGVRNHHRRHDPVDRYRRSTGGARDLVSQELEETAELLDRLSEGRELHVVRSNHDEAFDRWLKESDHKTDPVNAKIYLQTWIDMLDAIDRGEDPYAFKLYYERHNDRPNVNFLGRNERLRLGGNTCSFHGDKGPNGSRGSINSFAKMGIKTIIGHSHTPGIRGDCYQVGVTGKLDMGYNTLPSAWMNTHCVIYPNGERTLITIIDGEWRA